MDTQEKLDRLEINYDYLKEENRNLKNEIMGYKKIESKLNNVIKTLKEENKKLKEENKRLSDFLECEA